LSELDDDVDDDDVEDEEDEDGDGDEDEDEDTEDEEADDSGTTVFCFPETLGFLFTFSRSCTRFRFLRCNNSAFIKKLFLKNVTVHRILKRTLYVLTLKFRPLQNRSFHAE